MNLPLSCTCNHLSLRLAHYKCKHIRSVGGNLLFIYIEPHWSLQYKYTLFNYIQCMDIIRHSYILHPPYNQQTMHFGSLWHTYGIVSKYYSRGIVRCFFDYMQCIIGVYMALHIDDQHILYYHIDTYRSNMLGCSPDYLVAQGWITSMLLYPPNIHLTWPNVNCYTKYFPRVVGYDFLGNTIFTNIGVGFSYCWLNLEE